MTTPLNQAEIDTALDGLDDRWTQAGNALQATVVFADFQAAIAFMAAQAAAIDAAGHHPEWSNVYNRLTIRLTTHDAGDHITVKDVDLARLLDSALA